MFGINGYLSEKVSHNVYKVVASQYLPVQEAVRRFMGGCPVFSPNRIAGELHFTTVPYAPPAYFALPICPSEVTPEDIESAILPSHKEGDFYHEGRMLFSAARVHELKKEMILSCTDPCSLVVDFLDTVTSPGRALDLGCGMGVNSKILLRQGWHVTAIDKSPVAIEKSLALTTGAETRFSCIRANITDTDFPDSMDLIVAVDVLPYVSETDITSLLAKIYTALHPKGRFIGTFFTYTDRESRAVIGSKMLGAHHYRGHHIPAALLRRAGFEVECYVFRYNGEEKLGECVEFIASRPR